MIKIILFLPQLIWNPLGNVDQTLLYQIQNVRTTLVCIANISMITPSTPR